MNREERLTQDINCIEFFLSDNFNVVVDFDEEGLNEYWFNPDDQDDSGVVSIDSTMPLEDQLFVILHEAGHVILRNNPDFEERFPDSTRANKEGRIEILKEEVLAWEEARNLITRFAIDKSEFFNKTKWKVNYRDALSKYASWVELGDEKDAADED